MATQLTQIQIGQRLAFYRKKKGLSQEDLAINIKISRSVLAQIERGNRGLDVTELHRISLELGFSIDHFMSKNWNADAYVPLKEDKKVSEPQVRISSPKLQTQKLKNILLYILERCAGKPNIGETVLNKLLYFCDFNYYELYEEHLTGATYHKLPYGPVPVSLDTLIKQMISDKQVQRVKASFHSYTQTRYLPLEKANLKELKASETEVIDHVIEQMSDWSAATISNYSHKDIPWLASKEGEAINYELAFYREAPFSVRNYGDEMEVE